MGDSRAASWPETPPRATPGAGLDLRQAAAGRPLTWPSGASVLAALHDRDQTAFRLALNEFAQAVAILADGTPVGAALLCYEVVRTIADGAGAEAPGVDPQREELIARLGAASNADSLTRAFVEEIERITAPHFCARSPRRPAVVRARRFIEDHAGEPISLTRVAHEIGVARTYLSALFRRECGVTLTQYIHQVRIRRAEAMLRAGGLSIGEVALRSGYKSYRHFHRSFLKLRRVSPRAFVKNARGPAEPRLSRPAGRLPATPPC